MPAKVETYDMNGHRDESLLHDVGKMIASIQHYESPPLSKHQEVSLVKYYCNAKCVEGYVLDLCVQMMNSPRESYHHVYDEEVKRDHPAKWKEQVRWWQEKWERHGESAPNRLSMSKMI